MMFTNMHDLVKATREKYEGVEKLSKRASGYCFYTHDINGVGCAIGCHFPADLARQFDGDEPAISQTVDDILRNLDLGVEFCKVISMDIDIDDLAHLQAVHDDSQSAAEFCWHLDCYLEAGEWPDDEVLLLEMMPQEEPEPA